MASGKTGRRSKLAIYFLVSLELALASLALFLQECPFLLRWSWARRRR